MAILYDGFATVIGLGNPPGFLFREKTVTPPELDGNGGVDTVSMRNIRMRTKAPKKLLGVGDLKMTVYWDPRLYTQIIAQFQINQSIFVRFADGSTVTFYGWLDKFTPQEHREGENPLADITVVMSSAQGADALGAEISPAYDAGPVTVAQARH